MSAGRFTLSKYESNSGDVYAINLQPETIAATFGGDANDAPAGAVNQPIRAKVSKSRREYGVGSRKVSIRFTAAPPTGYAENQLYSLPVLTPTLWDGINPGTVGEYLGAATVVVSKLPESIR